MQGPRVSAALCHAGSVKVSENRCSLWSLGPQEGSPKGEHLGL